MLAAIGYQVYVGGDPWNYWRLLAPVVPLLAVAFICVVSNAVNRVPDGGVGAKCPNATLGLRELVLSVVVVVGLLCLDWQFLGEMTGQTLPYQVEANRRNVNTAIVLEYATTTDATVGVYWAGAIPYFTGRRSIDFLGKSDKYIARLPPDTTGAVSWNGMNSVPGHNKFDLNYSIIGQEPTYVQGFKRGRQDVSGWAATRYVKAECSGIVLFLRKDSRAVIWKRINEGVEGKGAIGSRTRLGCIASPL